MAREQKNEISVEELMLQIQKKVIDEKSFTLNETTQIGYRDFPIASSFDWLQIDRNLDIAEQHADVNKKVFSLLRFHRSIRWLAKLVSRLLLYLLQIITIPQGYFNQSILSVLRVIRNGIRQMEGRFIDEIGAEQMTCVQKNIERLSEEIKEIKDWIRANLNEHDNKIDHLTKEIEELKNKRDL